MHGFLMKQTQASTLLQIVIGEMKKWQKKKKKKKKKK